MFVRTKIYNSIKAQLANANATTLHFRDIMANMLGVSHEGKRSLYDVYGYPKRYSFINGYDAISREGIANRVVQGVAASCWRNGFAIKEGTPDDETAEIVLADEINLLNKKLIFSMFERADILNRIGRFSVLFVGVPDGLDLDQPIGKVQGDALKSIYFRAYAYDGIEISEYNTDENNERFGMPELYQLSVESRGQNDKEVKTKALVVHYTRVVHLAENLLDSNIEGIPAIQPIYNRILDIDKATGGAAEAYFRNSRGKIAFEIDPEFSTQIIDNPEAKAAFDEAGKAFTNDWQDQITAVGANVKSIVTPHADPASTVKTALWAISGYTGIPIRVLTGEGGGQLAGSEDRLAYNGLVSDRQDHTCSQWVIDLLEILESAGMITLPEQYFIEYPLDEPLTEFDKAELANKRADTLTKLTAAASSMGGDSINLKSALAAFNLDDIDVDEADDLDLDLEDVDPNLPEQTELPFDVDDGGE